MPIPTFGLKFALSPDGYKRLDDVVADPETASDTTVADFASHYFQYDDSTRCATRSDVAGGEISNTITYALNSPEPILNSTNWVRKAVMTTPDSSTKTVYSNNAGQDLLVDNQNGMNRWITHWKYNSDYRVVEFVHPSAIDMTDPYDDGDDDLDVNIKASDGLVDVTTYYTETDNNTGKVAGYPEFRKVRKGTSTTEFDVSKSQYNLRLVGTSPTVTTLPYLTKQTVYRSESGDPVDTSFSHQWEANTVHLEKLTTTLPEIQSGENPVGDTSSDTVIEDYDSQGRLFNKNCDR